MDKKKRITRKEWMDGWTSSMVSGIDAINKLVDAFQQDINICNNALFLIGEWLGNEIEIPPELWEKHRDNSGKQLFLLRVTLDDQNHKIILEKKQISADVENEEKSEE